jgi:PTS system mannose-specific IIA component
MSIALLLVTHVNIGKDMLMVAENILGEKAVNTTCIDVPMDSETVIIEQQALDALAALDSRDGALILTDTYGSTPDNIARGILRSCQCKLISGLNLPMLIRILNYRDLPLDELTGRALAGGRKGITVHNL